ncbi:MULTISPECIES: right-handed parallel beta-helix repeat-containing protein [Methylobacterium]|uniref:right-handed parallel beta-helix repeat-containing protein n=1 Tax=Methylobacterium TaxID=407 RepID=UPI00272DD468|nr:right-handed parallel beta-helix repeat-containing protein [Methylobacterium sp.]
MRLSRLLATVSALTIVPTLALALGVAPVVPVPNRATNDNSAAPANTRYVDSAVKILLDALSSGAPAVDGSGLRVRPAPGSDLFDLAALLSDMAPARLYGVRCDGLADDTQAIARAFRSAPVVLMPRGTCLVAAAAVPAGGTLQGQGDATYLRAKVGTTALTLGKGASVRRLKVDGNAPDQPADVDCIVASGVGAVTLDDVTVGGCKRHAFSVLSNTDRADRTETRIVNSRLGAYQDALHWEDSGAIVVRGGSLSGGQAGMGDGGSIYGSSDITADGVTFDGGTNGIYARAGLTCPDSTKPTECWLDPAKGYTQRLVVRDSRFRNQQYFGVLFAGRSLSIDGSSFLNVGIPSDRSHWTRSAVIGPGFDMRVTNSLFDGVGGDGIDFGGAVGCSAIGNTFRNINVMAVEVNSAQNCLVADNTIYATWMTTAFPGSPIKGAIQVQRDAETILPALRLRASGTVLRNNTLLPYGGATRAIWVDDDGTDTKATLTYIAGNVARGWGAGRAITSGSPSTVQWQNTTDDAPTAAGAWTDFTPSLACPSGSLGSASATGRYFIHPGGSVSVQIKVAVTTNGTCGGYGLRVGLPRGVNGIGGKWVGKGPSGVITGDFTAYDSVVVLQKLDGGYPAADGATLEIGGSYLLN